jgi:imidazolonepropionase-like amidohydrolase
MLVSSEGINMDSERLASAQRTDGVRFKMSSTGVRDAWRSLAAYTVPDPARAGHCRRSVIAGDNRHAHSLTFGNVPRRSPSASCMSPSSATHRNPTPTMRILSLLLLVAPALLSAQAPVLFHDVRVFDGTGVVAHQDVLVREGKFAQIAAHITPPSGARTVDGAGKTLLPGLIDSHTHVWANALTTALMFGVTTELDMFSDAAAARAMRTEQATGKASGRADLFSAGTLVTVPGGHGTEYGTSIPTILAPSEAQAFVDARIAEGSDYIKIVNDDGHTYGLSWTPMSPELLRALVDAAHKRGKLAVVHIGDLAGARAAIAAGADGLAHLFVDRAPDPEFGQYVATHKAFVVPTLTVLMSITGTPGAGMLANDARMSAYLTKQDVAMLRQAFPRRPDLPPKSYAAAEETVRQLHDAHVPILAGTDAGNPGTAHGAALHRELELLVKAGLTPTEALAAATSVPAKTFHLSDRGRIAPGLRADALLVDGDPTTDITATRNIMSVWKVGVEVDRATFARAIAAANTAHASKPAGLASGDISDFDDGTTTSRFGTGWDGSNDAMAGGRSTATIAVVDGGAQGTSKSLAITGTISPAFSQAWAGAMFTPGDRMFQPADLSSMTELRFWAKGDGKTYRVFVFAESKGNAPSTQTFVAGAEWKEYVFPFSAFRGIDGHGLMAIIFGGGPAPGAFDFRIDNVSVR